MQVGIIGAGPAGLSAAYELSQSHVDTTVFEQDPVFVGGISRTVKYHGYRFDIGGHRFFSKSDLIESFWAEILGDDLLTRRRLSRIYFGNHFFDYPLKAGNSFKNMGLTNTVACLVDYAKAKAFPRRNVVSFEDWVVNNFGERLYSMFFKTYTEKVWGIDCSEINADWAGQRIKGLDLGSAIKNAIFPQRSTNKDQFIKTLIDEFRYPKLGPGMLWERIRDRIIENGASVLMDHKIASIICKQGHAVEVVAKTSNGHNITVAVDALISSMPIRSLVRALGDTVPSRLKVAAESLKYRDFITVALVVDTEHVSDDTWIYIHDPKVQVGRIQNFKNWSPFMVPDPSKTCLGMEYFCFEGDGLWSSSDNDLLALAEQELKTIGLLSNVRVIDGTVVRVPKAYPVYDDVYRDNVQTVVLELGRIASNIQLIGRNGMHRYNNQDHAMMTGFLAAKNLLGSSFDLWAVNGDAEYLEEVSEERQIPKRMAGGPS